jgi:hypothetical protein
MKLGDLLSDLQCAIVGGAATRTYQPERYTNSIDVLVATTDVPAVRARLRDGGGHQGTSLAIPDSALGIEGDVWQLPHVGQLDVLWSKAPWVPDALASTIRDDQGLAIIGLPYLIAMKLDASRSVDQGDLSRMLGFANDDALNAVRTVVADLLPTITQDLERYIEIGRLEIGEHRDR